MVFWFLRVTSFFLLFSSSKACQLELLFFLFFFFFTLHVDMLIMNKTNRTKYISCLLFVKGQQRMMNEIGY